MLYFTDYFAANIFYQSTQIIRDATIRYANKIVIGCSLADWHKQRDIIKENITLIWPLCRGKLQLLGGSISVCLIHLEVCQQNYEASGDLKDLDNDICVNLIFNLLDNAESLNKLAADEVTHHLMGLTYEIKGHLKQRIKD